MTSFIAPGGIAEKIRNSIANRHTPACNWITSGILREVARGRWHSDQQPAETEFRFRHFIPSKETPNNRSRECFYLILTCGTNLDPGRRTGYIRRKSTHQRIVELGNAVTAMGQDVIQTRVSVRTYLYADWRFSAPKKVFHFVDIVRCKRTVHADGDCVRQG